MPRQFELGSRLNSADVTEATSRFVDSFNDDNAHEPSHLLTNIEECDYIVDLVLSGEDEPYSDMLLPYSDSTAKSLERTIHSLHADDHTGRQQCHTFRAIAVEQFVDQANTRALVRAFYVPELFRQFIGRMRRTVTDTARRFGVRLPAWIADSSRTQAQSADDDNQSDDSQSAHDDPLTPRFIQYELLQRTWEDCSSSSSGSDISGSIDSHSLAD